MRLRSSRRAIQPASGRGRVFDLIDAEEGFGMDRGFPASGIESRDIERRDRRSEVVRNFPRTRGMREDRRSFGGEVVYEEHPLIPFPGE